MKTLPVFRALFAILFSLAFAQVGWGQTTIGIHDFETVSGYAGVRDTMLQKALPTTNANPRFPALRSGLGRRSAAETPPMALSGASRRKQIPWR